MTLIMRVKEERWIKPVCTGPSLSTGAAPILFQTEVTVTPTEGWRGWRVGWSDRRTGPFQRLFGLTMGCFCLAKLCACVCGCDGVQGRGRNSCYLMEPLTHTHTQFPSLTLCFDLALTWASIWFTCPQGISSSCCQLITLCPTIYSTPVAAEISDHQLMLTPVCPRCKVRLTLID